MKIIHLILSSFYKEGYGYQENILPKKHKELGLETTIVTRYADANIFPPHDKKNDGYLYTNKDGIKVYILPTNENPLRKLPLMSRLLNHTKKLYTILEKLSPDIIFCHGIFISDYRVVCKYKLKNKNVRIFVDNHSDYYNTPFRNNLLHHIYRELYQKPLLNALQRSAEMFWGVTPWRVDYMRDVFSLNKDKTDLLVMGGDETFINWNNRDKIREEIRAKYNIPNEDFLIVSGGKIDKAKNIHYLIEAVKNKVHVTLLLFGSVNDEMKYIITDRSIPNVIYIGWVDSTSVYNLFLASNLAVFPGTHSVLWEQSCACGLPGIFKDWNGQMRHVDVGGNCRFISLVNEETLSIAISEICNNPELYKKMKCIAEERARLEFSYCNIAKRAILM